MSDSRPTPIPRFFEPDEAGLLRFLAARIDLGDWDEFVDRYTAPPAPRDAETAEELKRHFDELGKSARCNPALQDAVVGAAKDAQGPAVILLSPGFSSFDQFRGYAERGLVFERAATALAQRS